MEKDQNSHFCQLYLKITVVNKSKIRVECCCPPPLGFYNYLHDNDADQLRLTNL